MADAPGRAYVGVGSNIHPEINVPKALELLSGTPGITLTGISTFYRTAPLSDPADTTVPPGQGPVDPDPDPDFLNGVLEVRTGFSAPELLVLFARIEESLGRIRPGNRFAPRTMDLDLLLYGRAYQSDPEPEWESVNGDGAMVHPDIERRAFVAHPLLELAPDLILPPHRTPLRALAASFDSPGGRPETEFTAELRRRFLVA